MIKFVARIYYLFFVPFALTATVGWSEVNPILIFVLWGLFFVLNIISVGYAMRSRRSNGARDRLTGSFIPTATVFIVLYVILHFRLRLSQQHFSIETLFAIPVDVLTALIECFFLVFIWNILSRIIRGVTKSGIPGETSKPGGGFTIPRIGKRAPGATDGVAHGNLIEYGAPGAGLHSSGFDQRNIDMGVEGEIEFSNTAKKYFSNYPVKVALVNSIKFGGSMGNSQADVDHVIIVGKNMYIVDSKCWGSGEYSLVSSDTVRRDFMKFDKATRTSTPAVEMRTIHMDSALDKYRSQVSARGWSAPFAGIGICQWSGSRGNFHVRHQNTRKNSIILGTMDDIMRDIDIHARRYNLHDADPGLVDYVAQFRK